MSTPPEIAARPHFHAPHYTQTNPVFLADDGKASWLLLPRSLLSAGAVQPENTYSCILKVTGRV